MLKVFNLGLCKQSLLVIKSPINPRYHVNPRLGVHGCTKIDFA